MNSLYKLSLVPQDMRREDTIIQIADTLDYMDQMVTEIFQTIDARIAQNQKSIGDLSARIQMCQKKVQTLSGTNKATVVYSCTKYPGTDLLKAYQSCFPKSKGTKPTKSSDLLMKYNTKSKKTPLNENINEKLHFYHVKVNDNSEKPFDPKKNQNLPTNLTSVSDLLLFNSSKNSYMQSARFTSNTRRSTIFTMKKSTDSWSNLEAPPQSITSRESLMRNQQTEYFYSPHIGEVPTIDVPIDLPDLPGIADGLRYDMESGPAIAPSVITSPVLPELPVIEDITKHMPPPPLKVPIKDEVQVVVPDVAPCPPPPPPPPPPPEPEPEEKPLPVIGEPVKKEKPKVLPGASEMRSSLMEAIRNAGGIQKAKLKKPITAKVPTTDDTQVTQKSSENFLDDLHAKLALRRRGISGVKNSDSGTTDISGNPMANAFSRLSNLIPPPPKASNDGGTTTETDNESWDDD